MVLKSDNWETGFQKITNDVYCYLTKGTLMLSNAGLIIGDNCAMLFDVLSTVSLTKEFLEECRKVTDKPIKYIVVSHSHGDHLLGMNGVKGFAEPILIGHKNMERALASNAIDAPIEVLKEKMKFIDLTDAVYPKMDIYIEDEIKIDLGNRMVVIKCSESCHTDTDIYAYIPDLNMVFLGDLLFAYIIPVTRQGDTDNWIKLLDELIAHENLEVVIPGHGPICSKVELAVLKEYLEDIKHGAEDVVAGK